MKISLHKSDGKMLTLEEENPSEDHNESRFRRMVNHFRIFKWFITANVLILLIFCSYALCSLYQLESAMRSRENVVGLDRYLEKGPPFSSNDNDSTAVTDFREWRNSILRSLENLQEERPSNESTQNLKLLLHTITSLVRNAVDSNRDSRVQELVIANLTNFEIHILREFTRLKMLENGRTRIPRTTYGGKDESRCQLNFSFSASENGKPLKVKVEPAEKKRGNVNISNSVEYPGKEPIIRECSFKITYEPEKKASSN